MKLIPALRAVALAAATVLCAGNASAQTYPTKPIKFVVPVTPGGAIDVVARLVAEKLNVAFGQPVVVENKPGATNNLGADYVAKSAPDGYTILIVASSHATVKALFKDLSYDPIKDFEPIVYTHVVPLVLAVHPSVPAKTVAELAAWVKANPDKAKFASSGPGGSLHMAAELFMSMTGTQMTHVPYKGSAAAHPDLLAGRTSMIFDTITAIQGHVKSGAVRGLAVTTKERSPALPDLPPIADTLAGYDASTWGGILAPAGTPKAVVAKLNSAINTALKSDDVRAKMMAAGMMVQGGSPEAFAAVLASETEKWTKVIKDAGIQPE